MRRFFPLLLVPFAALAAAVLIVGAATAQEKTDESAWPAVFRDTTEVRVIDVDVVVTDRQGRSVAGLGKDDFELYADGRPIEITHFYAIDSGKVVADAEPEKADTGASSEPTPVKDRRLHLAVFVDSPNLNAINRARVFSHLKELLLEHRRDDAHVTLASPSPTGSGLLIAGSSNVPHEIFAALAELEGKANIVGHLERERRRLIRGLEEIPMSAGLSLMGGGSANGPDPVEVYRDLAAALLPQIRAYSQQHFESTRRSFDSLSRMVDRLAGLPGTKALLYVSDGLPMRSGEALYFAYSERVQAMNLGGSFSADSEASRYDASSYFTALVERANAAQVSFYPLAAAPPAGSRRGSVEIGSSSHQGSLVSIDAGNRASSLTFMAGETGGIAALAATAYDATLNQLYDDFDNHYSLGFSPAADVASGSHSLEVRARGEGLVVRHRSSWVPRTREQRMAEHTLGTLFTEGENPLDVAVTAGEPEALDDNHVTVPFLVEVPIDRLVLLPEKTEHQAQVSLYVAARDEKGRMSDVARHICPIRIPNSEILVAMGRRTVCGLKLTLRTGRQNVVFAVHDELADIVATASLRVDVQSALPVAKDNGDRP